MKDLSLLEIVLALGFKSEEELHRLVSEVDLTSAKGMEAFKTWQAADGSKKGLLTLLGRDADC